MTLFLEPFAPLFGAFGSGAAVRPFVPPADVVVTDDDVTVTMDVPGFTRENLSIELIGEALTVSGERKLHYQRKGEDDRVWQRIERAFGTFERVVQVPKGLDPERITASLTDGVLTLHVPRPESRKPRRIEITTGTTEAPAIEATTDRELAGVA